MNVTLLEHTYDVVIADQEIRMICWGQCIKESVLSATYLAGSITALSYCALSNVTALARRPYSTTVANRIFDNHVVPSCLVAILCIETGLVHGIKGICWGIDGISSAASIACIGQNPPMIIQPLDIIRTEITNLLESLDP